MMPPMMTGDPEKDRLAMENFKVQEARFNERMQGLAGLQPQPLDPQQQIQEIMQQPTQSPLSLMQQQQQGLDGMTPEQILQKRAQQPQQQPTPEQLQMQQQAEQQQAFSQQISAQLAQQQQQALPGTTGEFGPLNNRQPTMQERMDQRRRPTAPVPRPPKAEGLGVSSFGGASSNDMQRMLNRGSISGNNMGDVQNQIGEMEAAAAPQPKPPHPFLSEPRQFPFNPLLNKTTPTDGLPLSTAGGIMGQAPPEMAQNIPLMQNQMAPVPGYGLPPVPQTSAGMGFSPPPMNPMQGGYGSAGMMGMAPPGMAQMAAFPQQTMQQGGYAPMQQARGSQNSPPIQSPFV